MQTAFALFRYIIKKAGPRPVDDPVRLTFAGYGCCKRYRYLYDGPIGLIPRVHRYTAGTGRYTRYPIQQQYRSRWWLPDQFKSSLKGYADRMAALHHTLLLGEVRIAAIRSAYPFSPGSCLCDFVSGDSFRHSFFKIFKDAMNFKIPFAVSILRLLNS